MEHKVFISYATEKEESSKSDLPHAEKICSTLESNGIGCWMAPRDVPPGADWKKEAIEAIKHSKVMVLIFSSNAAKSHWVDREVAEAVDAKIPIIPFCIEDGFKKSMLNFTIGNLHRLNAYNPPLEKHLETLVKSVRKFISKNIPTPLPAPTPSPPPITKKWIVLSALIIVLAAAAAIFLIFGPEKKPEDVKTVESIGIEVKKNEKGFWEANFGEGIVMVYIPQGIFKMGQTEVEKKWLIEKLGDSFYTNNYRDETPLKEPNLDGYWMGKTEVTVKQYMKFLNAVHSNYPEWLEENNPLNVRTGSNDYYRRFGADLTDDKYPIVGVSRDDTKAYCEWLSKQIAFTKKIGLEFNLPTEAQWEKAARGTDGRRYPWGDMDPSGKEANYADKTAYEETRDNRADQKVNDNFEFTSPVGYYKSQGESPYGLHDMAGNVQEWCESRYTRNYDANIEGDTYIIRGGGWNSTKYQIRCAYRYHLHPSDREGFLGFRLCMNMK